MKQPESGHCSGRFYRTSSSAGMLGMVLGTLLLAACGQKGPLYLPDQPPPASKPFSNCDVPTAPCRQPGAGSANSSPNTNTTPSAPAASTSVPVSSTVTPETSSP